MSEKVVSSHAKVWVISDTHFGHVLMAHTRGFEGNVTAHDKALVEAWNSVVGDKDTVWHLGDVYFREGYAALPYLKGHKRLVMGNHDANLEKYKMLSRWFEILAGAWVTGSAILTHVPVHPDQLNRFTLNVHGHTHASVVQHTIKCVPDPRYIPVSVEHLEDYKPILLQEAIRRGVK